MVKINTDNIIDNVESKITSTGKLCVQHVELANHLISSENKIQDRETLQASNKIENKFTLSANRTNPGRNCIIFNPNTFHSIEGIKTYCNLNNKSNNIIKVITQHTENLNEPESTPYSSQDKIVQLKAITNTDIDASFKEVSVRKYPPHARRYIEQNIKESLQIRYVGKAEKYLNQHLNVTHLEDEKGITRNISEVNEHDTLSIIYNCKDPTKTENKTNPVAKTL